MTRIEGYRNILSIIKDIRKGSIAQDEAEMLNTFENKIVLLLYKEDALSLDRNNDVREKPVRQIVAEENTPLPTNDIPDNEETDNSSPSIIPSLVRETQQSSVKKAQILPATSKNVIHQSVSQEQSFDDTAINETNLSDDMPTNEIRSLIKETQETPNTIEEDDMSDSEELVTTNNADSSFDEIGAILKSINERNSRNILNDVEEEPVVANKGRSSLDDDLLFPLHKTDVPENNPSPITEDNSANNTGSPFIRRGIKKAVTKTDDIPFSTDNEDKDVVRELKEDVADADSNDVVEDNNNSINPPVDNTESGGDPFTVDNTESSGNSLTSEGIEEIEEAVEADDISRDNLSQSDTDATSDMEEYHFVPPVGSGMPNIIDSSVNDVFVEEYEKDISEFVYQRSLINIKNPNGKSEHITCTIFPFVPVEEDRNMKILVVVEWGNEFIEASSFENEIEGSNMVRLQIGQHELLFQGGMKDWRFSARILPVGISSAIGESVEELDKVVNNPPKQRIRNGHIKFAYDAAEGIQGSIEIFAIKKSSDNKHKLVLVRRVEEFVDYAYPEDSPFMIQTIQGNKIVVAENRLGKIKAGVRDFTY